jgi:hypothetical protein
MKKLFLISVIIFTTLSNQSQPVFEKIFDYSEVDKVYDMILTSDSSLLIYGTSADAILLIKTDLEGELIWFKNYNWIVQPSFNYQIIESFSGFYYLTCSYTNKPFLMKIDNEGDSIWSKTWDTNNPDYLSKLTTIKQRNDGKFLISRENNNAQYTYPPASNTMIIDSLGNTFCSNYGNDNSTIHQTLLIDNEYLALSSHWLTSELIIRKYNTSCSFVSTHVYNFGNGSGDLISDGNGFFYFGCNYLIKADEFGNVAWTIDHYTDLYCTISSIILNEDKVISTGSRNGSNNMRYFFISICDTVGTIDTIYTEQSYFFQNGQKIIKIGNDLYIVGNLKIEEPPSTNSDIFLSKYALSSLTTSISTFNSKERNPINVFPSPANDKVIFESSESSSFVIASGSKILITNSYGQPIAQIPVTGNKTIFDCRHLLPGIYFYQFQTNQKTYSGKFLITR